MSGKVCSRNNVSIVQRVFHEDCNFATQKNTAQFFLYPSQRRTRASDMRTKVSPYCFTMASHYPLLSVINVHCSKVFEFAPDILLSRAPKIYSVLKGCLSYVRAVHGLTNEACLSDSIFQLERLFLGIRVEKG